MQSMQKALCTQGELLVKGSFTGTGGRTGWQVGKSLLDIIYVDSSSKVGESTREVNYVRASKTCDTSI
jgi:hypothetical protein